MYSCKKLKLWPEIFKPVFILLFLFGIFTCTTVLSQNSTLQPSPGVKSNREEIIPVKVYPKLLLIPFEPKLYISEIDRSLSPGDQKSFNRLRNNFRRGTDEQLLLRLNNSFRVFSLLQDSLNTAEDLRFIYGNISYKYTPLENRQTRTAEGAGDKKNGAAPPANPNIVNGQLRAESRDVPGYMNTLLLDEKLLSRLYNNYGSEYFLFVNELDLKLVNDPNSNPGFGDNSRLASLHYTVFDRSGKIVCSGKEDTMIPGDENDYAKIITAHFSKLAASLETNLLNALKKPEVPPGRSPMRFGMPTPRTGSVK